MDNNYELKYLKLLSKKFTTVQEVSTELINLSAILNLPKGTEHFLSDIHGEYDTFNHFLKNGSGVIRDKISIIFKDKSESDKDQLAFFVYYPKQMIKKYEGIIKETEFDSFLRKRLVDLIVLSNYLSQKYTKSKIRKTLPNQFVYIIQELIFENSNHTDKIEYYNTILDAIFHTKRERNFFIELARFIQRLTIDRLHIVGDIFDRGPSAHLVINKMINYHSIDIEWGNHDIIWMGAASGSELSICNVIRNSAKYSTLETLEEGYGINLVPLARFASKIYGDDPCTSFIPRTHDINQETDNSDFIAKIHKAITIIQFKLENEVIKRNPHFNMDDRLLLDKMNFENGTVIIEGKMYKMNDTNFPTISKDNPYKLTKEEMDIVKQLKNTFLNNDLLQNHIKYLFQAGQIYLKYNGNLLFHGCIPLDVFGDFSEVEIEGKVYKGKSLFEVLEQKVRYSFLNRYHKRNEEKDYFIFLWQCENSPLFGKKSMKTFEGYFINDKKTLHEEKNAYFTQRENKNVIKNIYKEFDIDLDKSKIINGHVPSDITLGDNPIKADGKIYAIDGGMSKQYSSKIRIGGYTLVSDSYSLFLVSHQRFNSKEELIEKEQDIISLVQSEEVNSNRVYLHNTDKGERLKDELNDLYKLLDAYRSGLIKENIKRIVK